MSLEQFLSTQLFSVMLIFARVGMALSLLPIIGEQFVSSNVRLLLALALSAVLAPVLGPGLPAMPADGLNLAMLIGGEVLVGAYLGTVARFLLLALEFAGVVMTLQTGLGAAQIFNPALGTPGSPYGSILGVLGLTIMLATNLHHILIEGIVASYQLFTPGTLLPLDDFLQVLTRLVGHSSLIGTKMAAPFLIAGIVFNVALAVLGRLVPQMQVFFVSLPLQVLGGFVLFLVGFSAAILLWYSDAETVLIDAYGIR